MPITQITLMPNLIIDSRYVLNDAGLKLDRSNQRKYWMLLGIRPPKQALQVIPYRRRTSSPNQKPLLSSQIDRKHPLAQGLVGCWLFNEGAGQKINDISGFNNNGIGNIPVWVVGQYGCLSFSAGLSNNVIVGDNQTTRITTPFTLVVNCQFSLDQNNKPIVAKWGITGGYTIYIDSSVNNRIGFAIKIGGTTFGAISTKTYNDGKFHLIVAVYTGNAVILDIDNGAERIVTTSVTGLVDTTTDALVFSGYSNQSGGFTGLISYVLLLQRSVTDAEIRQLNVDPYCFIQQRRFFGAGSYNPNPSLPSVPVVKNRTRSPIQKPALGAQIDWSNPLTRNLVACWLFNEGAGIPRSLVPLGGYTPNETAGRMVWQGGYGSFNTTVLGYGNVHLLQGGAATWIISLRPANISQTAGVLNKRNSYSGGGDEWSLGFNYTNNNNWSVESSPAFGSYRFDATGFSLTKFNQVVSVFDKLSATVVNSYLNATKLGLVASNPLGPADFAQTTDPLEIGRVNANLVFPYLGDIEYIYVFNRAFTVAEIQQINRDPYCFIKQPKRTFSGAGAFQTVSTTKIGGFLWPYRNRGTASPLQKPPVGSIIDKRHPLSQGLVGCWLFNENAGARLKDLSGSNDNGTLINGLANGWRVTNRGIGLKFLEASDQYVDLDWNLGLQALTYIVWVRAASFPNAYNSLINKKGVSYAQYFVTSAGKIAAYISTAGAATASSYDGSGTHTLSTDVWYQIAITYDSIQGLLGYVNAELDGIGQPDGFATNTPTDILSFGRDPGTGPGRNWNGDFLISQIYNRALKQQEIRSLFNEPYCFLIAPKKKFNPARQDLTAVITGGVIYNAVLSLASTLGLTISQTLDMFPALSIAVHEIFAPTTQVDFVASLTLNETNAMLRSVTADFLSAVTFNETNVASFVGSNSIGVSLTAGVTSGFSITTRVDFVGALTAAIAATFGPSAAATFLSSLTMGVTDAFSALGGFEFSGSLSLPVNPAQSNSAGTGIFPGSSLGITAGFSDSTQAALVGVTTLAAHPSISLTGLMDALSSVTMAAHPTFSASAGFDIVVSVTLSESNSFSAAISLGINTSLSLNAVQALTTQANASLLASASLGISAAISEAPGLVMQLLTAFGISPTFTTSVGFAYQAALTLLVNNVYSNDASSTGFHPSVYVLLVPRDDRSLIVPRDDRSFKLPWN